MPKIKERQNTICCWFSENSSMAATSIFIYRDSISCGRSLWEGKSNSFYSALLVCNSNLVIMDNI